MSLKDPPQVATWMLEHLTPKDRNEALAGDLLEDFRGGPSNGWYRRQVIASIAASWIRSVFDHRIALFFAAIWSIGSPAWQLIFTRLERQSNFIGYIWRIPWPWSTLCDVGLSMAEDLIFIWIGALVYVMVLVSMRRTVNFRRVAYGFVMSLFVFIVASAGEMVLLIGMSTTYSTGHGVDWRTLTILGVIGNFRSWDIIMRIPYLLGTAFALWGATSIVAKTEGLSG